MEHAYWLPSAEQLQVKEYFLKPDVKGQWLLPSLNISPNRELMKTGVGKALEYGSLRTKM